MLGGFVFRDRIIIFVTVDLTTKHYIMAYDSNILEEELKNKVAHDYFSTYDNTKIIGKIDFCIAIAKSASNDAVLFDTSRYTIAESLLWAEAKSGCRKDIYKSFVQLILTIGKARTFDQHLPPAFLGAFDAEKIGFIPYNKVMDIFSLSDFNWNITPSDHETKEFQLVYKQVKEIIEQGLYLFYYDRDDKELRKFIKQNFIVGKSQIAKIKIDKNNFVAIYQKWLKEVKPTIVVNWEKAKQANIIDADFYLADIFSKDNISIKEKLFVLLQQDHYELDRKEDALGLANRSSAQFNDNRVAHNIFWNRYIRPPKKEYWDYIAKRRDLLVAPDVRERKGSFFTPQSCVELSQKYLADALGEDWQDEYYIWDCAAGTGNLLNGLSNKHQIWASTLDQADVDVMHDRVKNGANLLDSHIFQFDFLNDPFSKLPQGLQDIINDKDKRKHLIIYINPPYAEATSAKTITGTGQNKANVATNTMVAKSYKHLLGKASNELFAQFFIRIHQEIGGCLLAEFSTLKILQAQNFADFRKIFSSTLKKIFIVPSFIFDNVDGNFPIGFFIWDTSTPQTYESVIADIYDKDIQAIGTKTFYCQLPASLNTWVKDFDYTGKRIGLISFYPSDFQNNGKFAILSQKQKRYCKDITDKNIVQWAIYFSVRYCIEATWLNDRDQFLSPNKQYKTDLDFHNDCIIYMLFHGQNRITSQHGTNHWIPFSEKEINSKDCFESNFMSKLLNTRRTALNLSKEAEEVYHAGLMLWKYYHSHDNININASLYDIKEYFQGRNKKGVMNKDSSDPQYQVLIKQLRDKLSILARKIEIKAYAYEFLKR
ncbi:MAG: hypothetical protein IKM69_05635 [Alistipes sp.]|nr:hypothetical protein [Alistipes sp.]